MDNHDEIMVTLGKLLAGVDGINTRLDKVNGRLDKHDDAIQGLQAINDQEIGRKSAFNWLGTFGAGAIGLIAGLIGSFIQAGKL